MHVLRSSKRFTNHSWQDWKSIYNSHTDFKISPIMIWVHKKQAKFIDAQSHKYKGTRQNMLWDKTQQCQSNFLDFLLFGFSTFFVVFGFLTHNKEKIVKKQLSKDN